MSSFSLDLSKAQLSFGMKVKYINKIVCGSVEKYTGLISKQSPMGILKRATLNFFSKLTGKDLCQTL